MQLRPYQKEAIKTIKSTFTNRQKQYIVMPTGSGKTVTFLSYATESHKKILIVVPNIEIFKQVYETYVNLYGKVGISRKGDSINQEIDNVHVVIINSVKEEYLEKLVNENFDLTIIDEAHHSQSKSYRRLIDALKKKTKILGVTATPDRRDGLLLDEILEYRSFQIEIDQLIKEGYLCDIQGYSVSTHCDLEEVDTHNGDYNLRDLYKKLCNDSRNELIVKSYAKSLTDRKTLIFCVNIDHSKILAKKFIDSGIPCSHIDGKMSQKERNKILEDFRTGKINVLCNCQLLTEGFDEPSIDGIILARPTISRALFIQMIGRGLRSYPGKKDCIIIDMVDNHKKGCSFNSIISTEFNGPILSFSSLNDLKKKHDEIIYRNMEVIIRKADILNFRAIDDEDATEAMIEYLKKNNVKFYEPLSFVEGAFLRFLNELHKEMNNGNN